MRTLVGFLACLAIGCASSSAARSSTPAPRVQAPEVDPDARSLAFAKQLAAGEWDAAFAQLSERMKQAVGAKEQLAGVWLQASAQLGDSATLRIDERREKDEHAIRFLQLDGASGSLRVQLAVDRADGRIAGMYFVPPKPRPTSERSGELTVGSAPFVLGGTFTPARGDGPHPAVVLVAGSGPQDRDGTLGPNKPLRDLAEQLAAQGVSALRYDKRTRVHAMDVQAVTVEEEVIADAVAAAKLLGTRDDVRHDCVVVVGHSLGALLAPEITARAQAVAATVLLAAPGRPLTEVVVQQLRALKQLPEAELTRLAQQASELRAGKLAPDETFLSVPVRYWTDLERRDELALARRNAKPVLYLRGARDYQVLAEDMEAWRRGLSGLKSAWFETLPGLNHLFLSGEGPSGPDEYARPGTVAPVVSTRIARFIADACPKTK